MYRVIVVDDEIWSVIGLKKIIQEDSQRFELVYETTDPLDALEQICEKKPDIVFTDVRMPEMSGIDLMRNVRKRGVKTEFIVISGFAEFSYVQQALHEGAVDYQLKPFDRAAAKNMLDKVYEKLESKRKMSDLEFYSLLRDRKENIVNLLKSRFDHVLYKYLQVVLLYHSDSEFRGNRINTGTDSQCLALKIGPRKWLYIVNSSEDRSDVIFGELCEFSEKFEKAALSRADEYMDSFELLLKEAESAIMDSFVYPGCKVFRYRRAKPEIITQINERMMELDRDRKFIQVASLVSDWQNIFTSNEMGSEDALNLWNKTAYCSRKWAKNPNEVLDYMDLHEMSDRFGTLQDMAKYLNSSYEYKIMDQSGTANDKFFEMLQYIDQNYAQHLSLKELCSKFYINMSYCCELFQKNKSMTFSQYLTDVRISKACELLKYHHNTVAEACELVGYKDYFYFNKVFKKKMGCTPAEYRKSVQMES